MAEGYIENSLGNKIRIFERIVDVEKPSTSTGISLTRISAPTPSSTFKELPKTSENSHLDRESATVIPLNSIDVADLPSIVLQDETQNIFDLAGSPERDTQPIIFELPNNCPSTSAQDCNKTIVLNWIENIDSVLNVKIPNITPEKSNKIPRTSSYPSKAAGNFPSSSLPSPKRLKEDIPLEHANNGNQSHDSLLILSTPNLKFDKCQIDNIIINNYYYEIDENNNRWI